MRRRSRVATEQGLFMCKKFEQFPYAGTQVDSLCCVCHASIVYMIENVNKNRSNYLENSFVNFIS